MTYVFDSLDVSSIGANGAVQTGTKIRGSRGQGTRIIRFQYQFMLRGKVAGEGPFIIGFSRANISDSEIADFYTSEPQNAQDVPGIDQVRLDVYPVMIAGISQTVAPNAQPDMLAGWRTLKWPWRHLPEGDSLNVHVFNDGGTPTGSPVVDFYLKIIEEFVNV